MPGALIMAKEPAGPGRDVANAAIFREMLNMAKVIATHEGVTIADAFERHTKAALTKRYRAVLGELQKSFDAQGE